MCQEHVVTCRISAIQSKTSKHSGSQCDKGRKRWVRMSQLLLSVTAASQRIGRKKAFIGHETRRKTRVFLPLVVDRQSRKRKKRDGGDDFAFERKPFQIGDRHYLRNLQCCRCASVKKSLIAEDKIRIRTLGHALLLSHLNSHWSTKYSKIVQLWNLTTSQASSGQLLLSVRNKQETCKEKHYWLLLCLWDAHYIDLHHHHLNL